MLADSQYYTAAERAASFIQAHMFAPVQDGIIQDTFTLARCQFRNNPTWSSNSGFALWGLSVLASHNASWTPLYASLLSLPLPLESPLTNSRYRRAHQPQLLDFFKHRVSMDRRINWHFI